MQHKDAEVVTPQLTVTNNVGSVRNVGTREQEPARVEEWHAGFSSARYIILSATDTDKTCCCCSIAHIVGII